MIDTTMTLFTTMIKQRAPASQSECIRFHNSFFHHQIQLEYTGRVSLIYDKHRATMITSLKDLSTLSNQQHDKYYKDDDS
jgi:hypothetical protein